MKFIIDENVTPDLVYTFRQAKLNAYHVNELKRKKAQRVIDDQLRSLALRKGYVIVTKDDDFVRSYVHRKVPDQMIFIYGLESKSNLLERFSIIAPQLPNLIAEHDFIEVTDQEIKTPFS